MKNLFTLDYKKLEDKVWNNLDNPVLQMFERYSLNLGNYGENELTEVMFNRLGWTAKCTNTIFSFYTLIFRIIEVYSHENIILIKGGNRIEFCYIDNVLKCSVDGVYRVKESYAKKNLYKKAIDGFQPLKLVLDKIFEDSEVFSSLKTYASLVDSLSNFTPYPEFPFSHVMDCLSKSGDDLNLMVDRIQKCIDDKSALSCREYLKTKGNSIFIVKEICLKDLRVWKKWFVNNRSLYCLNGLYELVDNRIEGVKLFEGQSLTKPFPSNRNEILEYLNNVNAVLIKRGKSMSMSKD